jgi:hypothetical protein
MMDADQISEHETDAAVLAFRAEAEANKARSDKLAEVWELLLSSTEDERLESLRKGACNPFLFEKLRAVMPDVSVADAMSHDDWVGRQRAILIGLVLERLGYDCVRLMEIVRKAPPAFFA